MTFRRIACGILLAVTLTVRPALSAEEAGTLTLLIENDLFGESDRHYTHGTRIAWLSPPAPRLPWWARLLEEVPLLDPGGEKRIGYAIGQNIYTPEDTEAREPLSDQRPYAGWLYGALSLTSATEDRLDRLELDIGIVGPWSLAEDVQKTWHRWFDLRELNGWDHQLHNEPGVMLIYERRWRLDRLETPAGFQVQLLPYLGGAAGNVMTYLSSGVGMRFGYDLPDDFGPPRIQPSLPGSAFFTPNRGFGWYLFAEAGGRAVARNIFLDGNTFRDSPSVDKKILVGDLQLGVALNFQTFRLTYTHVIRTPEFDGQDSPDSFGSFSLSVRF